MKLGWWYCYGGYEEEEQERARAEEEQLEGTSPVQPGSAAYQQVPGPPTIGLMVLVVHCRALHRALHTHCTWLRAGLREPGQGGPDHVRSGR